MHVAAIYRSENIALPGELASRIAITSGRNLRRAILMLEACKVSHGFSALQWLRTILSLVTPAQLLLPEGSALVALAHVPPQNNNTISQ